MQKPIVLLIDNSISFTGAFKCALQQAVLMKPSYEYIFLMPTQSDLISLVRQQGFRCYTLPFLEIRRSSRVLFLYLPRLLRNVRALRDIVTKEEVSIVIMNDFYNLAGAGLKLAGWKGKLITYVRFLPSAMPAPLRKTWISAALRFGDKVVAVSDAVAQQLPRHNKVVRIYDPVSFAEIHPPIIFDNDGTELLYLSNYIQGKGHDHAVNAFRLAYEKNRRLRLYFAGGDMGLEKNRSFKRYLQEQVQQIGLADVIQFFDYTSDVEGLMKRAHIFLNFSEAESFSMTCAEASFYGLPVIASRCGGPEEIVVHEESGLLVGNRDVEQMAKAILKLSGDKELRVKFSKNGQAYVKEKFSVNKFQEKLGGLLNGEIRGTKGVKRKLV